MFLYKSRFFLHSIITCLTYFIFTGCGGAVGPQGPTGEDGSQGPTGPSGEKGPQGSQGATGSTGEQGPQGSQGSIGPTGPQGSQGSTGPTGPAGSTQMCTNTSITFNLLNYFNDAFVFSQPIMYCDSADFPNSVSCYTTFTNWVYWPYAPGYYPQGGPEVIAEPETVVSTVGRVGLGPSPSGGSISVINLNPFHCDIYDPSYPNYMSSGFVFSVESIFLSLPVQGPGSCANYSYPKGKGLVCGDSLSGPAGTPPECCYVEAETTCYVDPIYGYC